MIELSSRQRATVASAITILSTFVIVVAVAAILYLVGVFFSRFSSVFLPLAVAAVIAFVVHPFYEFIRDRLRFPPVLAVVAVFGCILLPVSLFAWFFGSLIVDQVTGVVKAFPERVEGAVAYAQEHWPGVVGYIEDQELGQRARETAEKMASPIAEGVQSIFSSAGDFARAVMRGVGTVVTWAVLPIYFAFFLMGDPKKVLEVDHLLPFLKKDTRENVVYLVREFVNILVAFFRGQLIVAFLQGALFAIGFSVVGLKYGFVLGLMLGFLNIIPYLGNMVGLAIAIPLALFQEGGGWLLLGLVGIVFVLVQMIEGYFLTPKIMGDRTGLHPFVIIVAIFFWGSALGGISGMILAIPLTAFLVVFWRLAKEKYIGELV